MYERDKDEEHLNIYLITNYRSKKLTVLFLMILKIFIVLFSITLYSLHKNYYKLYNQKFEKVEINMKLEDDLSIEFDAEVNTSLDYTFPFKINKVFSFVSKYNKYPPENGKIDNSYNPFIYFQSTVAENYPKRKDKKK